MACKFTKTTLPDVLLIEPDVFHDPRGFFIETYHQTRYANEEIKQPFVQDNHSHSKKGTVRGLHYQFRRPQAKLIYVVTGEIFDVAVDIRRGSPTFGKWVGIILSAENKHQLYIPEGFAHGFSVLSESTDVMYKCTDFYDPAGEFGILWSDPDIGIDWRINNPIISKKDGLSPKLNEAPKSQLPVFRG